MIKRAFTLFLAAGLAVSMAACRDFSGGDSNPSSAQGEAAPEPTEAEVTAAYERAAEVYDWFDLCSLPTAGDPVGEDGRPYDPKGEEPPYRPVVYEGLSTYADLDVLVRKCFTQELADEIMGGHSYRDIGGRLCAADAARGSNLYLLGRAVSVERTAPDRWAITVTFYADSYAWERPSATVGYSQKTLDYVKTTDGWRFSTFCPSDALDVTAETVFHFTYDADSFLKDGHDMDAWSDLKLACWLLHADGAFAEGPGDILSLRLLDDPDGWFAALSVFPDSPWAYAEQAVRAASYQLCWLTPEQQAQFEGILRDYQPKNDAEQALLETLKTAWTQVNRQKTDG